MDGTGVRYGGIGGDVSPSVDLAAMTKQERIQTLRSRMSALGSAVSPAEKKAAEFQSELPMREDVLPAPDSFSRFLPGAGLPRRAVALFQDQPLLIAESLAHVTSMGGHAAVVGWEDFSYAGVLDFGGVYENIIAVPHPGSEPLNVVAVLCEGLDLVIYRGPEIMLSPTRARPLLGKIRKGTAALMMVGTRVQSPALTVAAEITDYLGIGPGRGRIKAVEMHIQVTARGQVPTSGKVVISSFGSAELLAVETKPKLRAV